MAEADYALWQVYSKYSAERSTEEVCRIGTRAVERRMIDVWTAAGRGRRRGWKDPTGDVSVTGERGRRRVVRSVRPKILSLDADRAAGLARTEPVALDKLSLREEVERAAEKMDAQTQLVLRELLDPGKETVDFSERWGAPSAVARGLGIEDSEVQRAIRKIRDLVREAAG